VSPNGDSILLPSIARNRRGTQLAAALGSEADNRQPGQHVSALPSLSLSGKFRHSISGVRVRGGVPSGASMLQKLPSTQMRTSILKPPHVAQKRKTIALSPRRLHGGATDILAAIRFDTLSSASTPSSDADRRRSTLSAMLEPITEPTTGEDALSTAVCPQLPSLSTLRQEQTWMTLHMPEAPTPTLPNLVNPRARGDREKMELMLESKTASSFADSKRTAGGRGVDAASTTAGASRKESATRGATRVRVSYVQGSISDLSPNVSFVS